MFSQFQCQTDSQAINLTQGHDIKLGAVLKQHEDTIL